MNAMRYEVAQELYRKMQDNQNCTADIKVQMRVLPSYTKLGMAALLPHNQLTMTDDYKIRIDDSNCEGVAVRDQKYDKDKQYYLSVVDEATGLELFRHLVIMDLAFADDFGF